MTYLITQILVCLLAAFLLGLLLGWWLWSRGCAAKIDAAVSEWRRKVSDLEAELAASRKKAADCEASLANLRSEADARLAALQGQLDAVRKEAADKLAQAQGLMAAAEKAARRDDLTKVEGIGPKIQELLYAAGIHTFEALSQTKAEKVKQILDAAGERFQMHDPKTWPEQAKLAADGRWKELQELQDVLRAGRED